MKDAFRIAHFNKKALLQEDPPRIEIERVRQTLKMVPRYWRRIIDVGCGDGRISRALIASGYEVLGLDWSVKSLLDYPGWCLACDIRMNWPIRELYDGAICSEVLEHMSPQEARQVIEQFKSHTANGFLITVPARESLEEEQITCGDCGLSFHIWGHLQTFADFDALDQLVGSRAIERRTICERTGLISLSFADKWRRKRGWYPYHNPACAHTVALL